jgi:hypothetical protein
LENKKQLNGDTVQNIYFNDQKEEQSPGDRNERAAPLILEPSDMQNLHNNHMIMSNSFKNDNSYTNNHQDRVVVDLKPKTEIISQQTDLRKERSSSKNASSQ